jgi:NAD(P)-dependent dehydrogenase (short-subunit alcohol dehydrogenase family)
MATESKAALVTGGSKGIGYAIASSLVEQGMRVAIAGRDRSELERARGKLTAKRDGSAVIAVAADVGNPDSVRAMMAAVAKDFGGLDVLVNNAGIGHFVSVADMSDAQWRETLDTNVGGIFYCSREAIPYLRRRGGGWIINISSLASKNPFADGAAYSASKAAVNAFSEALMQEVRYDNIRVTHILPGSVRTGFSGHPDGPATDWKLSPDDVARVVVDLLAHEARSLPSRIELRPSRPRK